jgi:hypothetical protein
MADGIHNFCVHATDASGLLGSDACRHWQQETNPTASITTHPSAVTAANSAAFTYTSNKAGHPADGSTLQYKCALDGSGFSACPAGGKAYTSLADGQHTFQVEAVFTAALGGGAHTSAAASYPWTVDTTGPAGVVLLESDPDDAAVVNDSGQASIGWTGTEDGETYVCALDNATEQSCSSPDVLSGLANGLHDLTIIPIDALSNRGTPTTVHWQQETAPTARILTHPALATTSRSAAFTYTSNKGGSTVAGDTVSFLCSLDGATYDACPTSGKSYTSLPLGSHTFRVESVYHASFDGQGVTHVSAPATYSWGVKRIPPKPSCRITLRSTKVHKGKVAVHVRCTQTVTAAVHAKITETIKHKHHVVKVAAKSRKIAANRTTSVTLRLGKAWKALKHHAKEKAVFTVAAHNANGTTSAHTKAVRLRR